MSVEWADEMQAIAAGEGEPAAAPIAVDWRRVTAENGARIDWQVVNGSHGLRGRRLLVVEMDAAAAGRIEAAIAVLAGNGQSLAASGPRL